MNGNLPPGTWEGDPRAPWNQSPEQCPDCKDDMDWDEHTETWACPSCGFSASEEDLEDDPRQDPDYLMEQAREAAMEDG